MDKIKITKIEEQGNGVEVSLSNGRKHWIGNDSWKTKEELKEKVRMAEKFVTTKNTTQELEEINTLVEEELEK